MQMMSNKWSIYQENIFDFVVNGSGSAVINAVAGSGKTTTSVEAANRLSKSTKVLFLAFNKSIVDELKSRFSSSNITCSTLHGYGNRCLRIAKLVTSTTKVDEDKWRKYFRTNLNRLSGFIFHDLKSNDFKNELDKCCDLFNMCRIFCLRKEKTLTHIEEINERFGIMASDITMGIVNDVLSVAYILKPGETIDFIDMICIPVMNKNIWDKCPKYDFVFIDEAQDLSMAQQELMKLSLGDGARFLAVGDPKQAINGFAGALNDSFDRLKEMANGKELPLSVNYRCPKNVINEAKEIVPYIQAHDGAEEGIIEHVDDLSDVDYGDMILCRKTSPLITIASKLISSGKRARIKGTDLGASLKRYINKSIDGGDTLSVLFNILDKEKRDIQKKIDSGKASKRDMMLYDERRDSIVALIGDADKPSDILPKVDLLFSDSDDSDYIKLSTIHKAKGLEADNVFIICQDCLPLKWENQQDWESEQEMNLKYVAITRAKKNLYWVNITETDIKKSLNKN